MAAAACGQDMEVPESTLYFTILLSLVPSLLIEFNPVNAAKMLNPGAVMSGCHK